MREIPVETVAPVRADDVAALAEALRRNATLQDVLEWCAGHAPPGRLVDVVVQDELTHDVVIELGGGLHAVHDTT